MHKRKIETKLKGQTSSRKPVSTAAESWVNNHTSIAASTSVEGNNMNRNTKMVTNKYI